MKTEEKLNMTMLCDFYELTMGNGYLEHGMQDRITYFDVFFRSVPDDGGYAIAAGLEQAIEYIQQLHFDEDDIAYLRSRNMFDEGFLSYLRDFRFTGDIWAVPEGTPIFPREPIMTVRAPAIQAQLVETFLLLTLCAGHVALAYDAQPGAARIFDGRPPEDFSLRYVDVWNDDRGSGTDFGCTDEAELKDYLAALQLETYTEALNRYGECRSLQLLFDAPEGTLSVTLADNQSIHVTRLWLKNAPSESYYLAEPIDWQLLDRLIVPRPALRVWFSLPGQDEDSCFFAGVYSMTQTLPDGTVQVLQEPDEGNYSAFGTTGGGRTVRLEFGQTLLEPYTVTCQTPDGSERRIFTQDELRGGRVPLLPGESADYTVAARLQGEDGSTYDAVFCFRYDRLAGGT